VTGVSSLLDTKPQGCSIPLTGDHCPRSRSRTRQGAGEMWKCVASRSNSGSVPIPASSAKGRFSVQMCAVAWLGPGWPCSIRTAAAENVAGEKQHKMLVESQRGGASLRLRCGRRVCPSVRHVEDRGGRSSWKAARGTGCPPGARSTRVPAVRGAYRSRCNRSRKKPATTRHNQVCEPTRPGRTAVATLFQGRPSWKSRGDRAGTGRSAPTGFPRRNRPSSIGMRLTASSQRAISARAASN